MPGDLGRLPAPVSLVASGAGPAALAVELPGRVRAELPAIGGLGEREHVLVSAWLTGLRSARTRRAYAGDVAAWLGWIAERETDALAAGRVHVDPWAATQLDDGAAASSVRRRVSALSSFYRYCAAHDVISRVPTQGVARSAVDPDTRPTIVAAGRAGVLFPCAVGGPGQSTLLWIARRERLDDCGNRRQYSGEGCKHCRDDHGRGRTELDYHETRQADYGQGDEYSGRNYVRIAAPVPHEVVLPFSLARVGSIERDPGCRRWMSLARARHVSHARVSGALLRCNAGRNETRQMLHTVYVGDIATAGAFCEDNGG